MAGRGPQSFKKRQKEQQRKEKQLEKAQKRVERKTLPRDSSDDDLVVLDWPLILPNSWMTSPMSPKTKAHPSSSLSKTESGTAVGIIESGLRVVLVTVNIAA